MAEGTNVIATRETANEKKPGSYTSDLKRCVTYSSVISTGLSVRNADRYTGNPNRLVRLDDLYVPSTITFKLVIDISASETLWRSGRVTLNTVGQELKDNAAGSAGPVSYAREIEATEVEQDTPEYSNTPDESNMNLSTLDEVLQVAQEFEEQEKLFGASGINPNRLVQITLTKAGSSANLLDASTYGPVAVSNKTVTYVIRSKTYSSSDAGNYTLSYPGTKSNYLMNKDGTYPVGGLYPSSSSSSHSQTLTVASAGTYTFNAVWRTPPTYVFRLRLSLDDIQADVRYVTINFSCKLFSSSGADLGACDLVDAEYRLDTLSNDIGNSNRLYYRIDLRTDLTTLPYYVRVLWTPIIVCKENSATEFEPYAYEQNTQYTGSSPSLPGSGRAYYSLNTNGNNVYTIDYVLRE